MATKKKLLRNLIIATALVVFIAPLLGWFISGLVTPKTVWNSRTHSYSSETVDISISNHTFRLAKAYLISSDLMRGGTSDGLLAIFNFPDMTPAGFEGSSLLAPFSPENNGNLYIRDFGPDVDELYSIKIPDNPKYPTQLRPIGSSEWIEGVERFIVSVGNASWGDETFMRRGRIIYKWALSDQDLVWASCDLEGSVPNPRCNIYFSYEDFIIEAGVPKTEPLDIKSTLKTLIAFFDRISVTNS
ncbi:MULTISPECIES: hypothetical protein [Thalassospira]|uniref:hypothetical protein n=1 Tax=Thalassospira TaxID=168934 RepID=UPI000C4A580E|nr:MULTISPECIES: hypothetical protein [Thalassospira]MAB33465.1 hypothetical protein [Thalassospira sp.]HBS21901.1 hypothetical protein [Thalassospira sp.]